jgi:hypothetical protein
MIDPKNCRHPEKFIKLIGFYRKNYPFGKKSGRVNYSIRRYKKVCDDCGTELERWKPDARI